MSKSKLFAPVLVLVAFMLVLSAGPARAEEDKPGDKNKQKHDIDYVEVEDDDAQPRKKPIGRKNAPPPENSVKGFLLLSSGDRVDGYVHLTRDAVLKFTHTEKKKVLRIRLDEVTHIEQVVTEEHMEKEWRWLENANDEKVYTGREYPMRKLETVIHMKSGKALRGLLSALIFVDNENGSRRFMLHKRQKGKPGTKMSDLVYVRIVDLRPPAKTDEKKSDKKEDSGTDRKTDSRKEDS